jgi:ABC-2 type transport system ATP-binding protein
VAGDTLLIFDDVERRFGKRIVVENVNITLKQGDRLALRGPNGSGKTTILRCAAGTVTPTRGTILVAGHPAGSRAARRAVGVSLSQDRSFYLRLSGRENLLFFAGIRGIRRRDARVVVESLEDELSLGPLLTQRVARCSTGMVQQLSFARALIGDPPILLLDEPTRSLDAAAAERFWAALDRRPETGLIIATHRDDDVRRCSSSFSLGADT